MSNVTPLFCSTRFSLSSQTDMGRKMKDITGMRFGSLVAINSTEQRDKNNHICWLCKCDCGEERIVSVRNLITGFTKSCRSCALKNLTEANRVRPKPPRQPDKWLKKERLYRIWQNMKARCSNPRCVNYKRYGGKGVSVCSEWINNFTCFREWALGHGYKEDLTIDRIDGNGNYSPDNCRWVTPREQTYNMENNIWIDFHGKRIALARLVHDFGLKRQQVYDYLRNIVE